MRAAIWPTLIAITLFGGNALAQEFTPDPVDDAVQADRFARAAIECNSMEPIALAVHGQVASYLYKDFDLAFRRFEAALRIQPDAQTREMVDRLRAAHR